MTCVLDTCALLCWTLEPDRLSPTGRAALEGEQGEDLLLCSMSIWELAWKQRMGKLSLGMTAEEYLRRVRQLPLQVVAVDADTWLANVVLDWEHRDPVDRTVVALARQQQARLLTSDRAMLEFYGRAFW